MKPEAVVIVDSREQCPFIFDNLPSKVATLDTGDYSIAEIEHLVAVERKSLDDLLACCGRDRDRFKRELSRMRGYRFRLLVVECNASDLESGCWRSALKPSHVLGSLAAWCCQYSLPIWLGGDHDCAGRFVEKFLYQCARAVLAETVAARGLLSVQVERTGEICEPSHV